MSAQLREYISTRQAGNARISLVCEMTGPMAVMLNVPEEEWRDELPEIAEEGTTELSMTSTVVEIGDTVIVIDPAFDTPGARLRNEIDAEFAGWQHGAGLQEALGQLDIESGQVNFVVLTHAHFDHCLGVAIEYGDDLVPRFPQARHVLPEADWQLWVERTQAAPPANETQFGKWGRLELWPRLQAIREAGILDLIEPPHSPVPGIEMLHTPGETPGHCVVRVESGGEVFYHLGDLLHYWFEAEHPDWVIDEGGGQRDVAAMLAAREQLFPQMVEENALATFTHAPFPGWGRIVSEGDGYRWEPSVSSG